MFVPVTIFTDKSDKRKETTGDATKPHHHKEESNVSKHKTQSSQIGTDKEIIRGEKLL